MSKKEKIDFEAKDVLTLDVIKNAVKAANEYKIPPLRYASTQVTEIKKGVYKGMYLIKEGAKSRKNGRMKFYLIAYGIEKHKKVICAPQAIAQ